MNIYLLVAKYITLSKDIHLTIKESDIVHRSIEKDIIPTEIVRRLFVKYTDIILEKDFYIDFYDNGRVLVIEANSVFSMS